MLFPGPFPGLYHELPQKLNQRFARSVFVLHGAALRLGRGDVHCILVSLLSCAGIKKAKTRGICLPTPFHHVSEDKERVEMPMPGRTSWEMSTGKGFKGGRLCTVPA